MDNEQLQALWQLGGAIGILVGASFFGINWVVKTVQGMRSSATVKTEKTTIITSDTVAMDQLAKTLEASNVILTENNVLRREEHKDREEMREAIEENTRAIDKSTQAVVDARAEIRELAREMARAGK